MTTDTYTLRMLASQLLRAADAYDQGVSDAQVPHRERAIDAIDALAAGISRCAAVLERDTANAEVSSPDRSLPTLRV